MVHAVSATYLKFEHMSPPAAGMALLLHASVALALYLVSPLKFAESQPPPPIEVTIERPPEPAPPAAPPAPAPAPGTTASATPPPPPPAARNPTAQVPASIAPPESKTTDKTVDKPSLPPTQPAPQPTPKPAEPQEALAPPKPTPELETVEKTLPQVAPPPAPLSMQDFVKIAPPPAPHEVAKTPPRPAPPPPQHPQLQHSPLSSQPHQPEPQTATAAPSNNSFSNPAATYARNRVIDEYKWAVIRKFSQYLPNLRQRGEGGTLVLRISIARDGRLLDVTIAQSSGVMALDRGMVEAIRAASPYAPLPAEISGDRFTFSQDITAAR